MSGPVRRRWRITFRGVASRAALEAHLNLIERMVRLDRGGWTPELVLNFDAWPAAGGWCGWAEAAFGPAFDAGRLALLPDCVVAPLD